jgi:hypothetical protein
MYFKRLGGGGVIVGVCVTLFFPRKNLRNAVFSRHSAFYEESLSYALVCYTLPLNLSKLPPELSSAFFFRDSTGLVGLDLLIVEV